MELVLALEGFFVEKVCKSPREIDPESYDVTAHGFGATFTITLNRDWFVNNKIRPVETLALENPQVIFGKGRSAEEVARQWGVTVRLDDSISQSEKTPYRIYTSDEVKCLTLFEDDEGISSFHITRTS